MPLDGETKALRDSAARFFGEADCIRLLRHWRDAGDFDSAARGCWQGVVDLGFAGILIPEEFGGSGLGSAASIQIAETMGRTLAAAPYLSSAVMSAAALRLGDNPALKAELLPRIAQGSVAALAAEEARRHAPLAVATIARRADRGFRISGRKLAVVDGAVADTLIVAARDGDDMDRLLLLAVDAGAPGISVSVRMGIDSHPLAEIAFAEVTVDQSGLVCAPAAGEALLDRVYDAGRLHLAAEMLGLAQEAFDRTVDYLKTRVQFGRKIGEFQALRHRAATLFGELEIARSVLLRAAATETALHISMAKAKIGDVANRVAGEAVQMHGGVGVTDDFDLGLFLKRIRAASELLGDSAFHTERYAVLRGL